MGSICMVDDKSRAMGGGKKRIVLDSTGTVLGAGHGWVSALNHRSGQVSARLGCQGD